MLLLLILLPALFGFASVFFRDKDRKALMIVSFIVQSIDVILLLLIILNVIPAEPIVSSITSTLGFSLKIDTLGALFAGLTMVGWLLTIPFSHAYIVNDDKEPYFQLFLFLTESAVLGIAFAGDFITFYIFFELTTLFSFPLILHDRKEFSIKASAKYLYYSVGGAFIALFGLAVLYTATSSLTFTAGGYLTESELSPLVLIGVFCTALGFGAKAGLYPLHNWLTAAHPAAPTPASALLSGIIAKAGIMASFRLFFNVTGPDLIRGTWVQYALITIALIGIFTGSFLGCLENGFKKRLAYSSISQISYILIGIFILTDAGIVGGVLQLIFHAMAKMGAFQCAGAIICLTGRSEVSQLRGIGRRIPGIMICFALLSLSLIGIPPFGGFWSKWYLGAAALSGLPGFLAYLVPAVLILSALLTAGYLFQPLIKAFFPGEDYPEELLVTIYQPRLMLIPIVIYTLLCGVLGFFPDAVVSLAQSVAQSLL